MKRKLIDLSNQRSQHLQAAEAALSANDVSKYDAEMEKVSNLNTEIQRVQNLIAEQERQIDARQPSRGEMTDMIEERANILRSGGEITFTEDEVRRAVRNSVTVATGTLAQPTGVDEQIRDPLGSMPSSILDHVSVMDLTGMGSFLVPYVVSDLTASSGKVATLAGTLRSGGSDPTFAYSEIRPYEVNVTQFVDRNIANLTAVPYYACIQNMALKAMRRQVAKLIVNGDGQGSPDMYGIKNAKNKQGNNIFATLHVSSIDENIMDDLYYEYGSDEACGENAYLYLHKKDLKAMGKLRNGDKQKIFRMNRITANEGVIDDSGSTTPYGIMRDLTPLSESVASGADIQTMLYGDPTNYLLGLFGGYTIRVDESYKAGERLTTILGDLMVGGNLVVDKGFVVATLPKTGD